MLFFERPLDDDQQDFAHTIKQSGETLLALINAILDFSKIESGKMEFEQIEFDPETTINDVMDLVKVRIGTLPIELLCSFGDHFPTCVVGAPYRFKQVITNLIGNAPKFTTEGEIEIVAQVSEEKETVLATKRLVIVDDNARQLEIIGNLLTNIGTEITAQTSGKELENAD